MKLKPAPQGAELDRRGFLKNAGLAAFAGAAGTSASTPVPTTTNAHLGREPASGRYDFDTPQNRFGTDSAKYDFPNRIYGKGSTVYGMGVADMDFRVAPAITKAMAERLHHEIWGYLDVPRSFLEDIAGWNKRRYGVDVNPDFMVIATGVHPALESALRTFAPPGSKVLLTTPAYNGFYGDLRYTGTKAEESPMKLVDGRYSIDFEDFERRISHDTNVFMLCNPHNPTGNCWSADDLMRLGEICLRRRVVVLADEIHCDLVTKRSHYTPFASLPNKAVVNNSITFKSTSKSFGLPGTKCAYFFSDNADYIARVQANHREELSTMGMIATRAAYTRGEKWLDQCVAYLDGNHDYVESFVRDNMPLVKVVKPQATYLAWLDVSAVIDKLGAKAAAAAENNAAGKPLTAEKWLERYLVKNAKVHLMAGSSFGLGGAGHMRMNIATSRKTLALALNNLASALRSV